MTEYAQLLPKHVPTWHLPFWDGLKDQRILVQQCASCQKLRHTPKELCAHCHSAEYVWAEIAPTGTIFTYTVVHRAPTQAYQQDAPYVIAHVAMDDGVRMIANIVGMEPSKVSIGQPVIAVFDAVTPERTLLRFTPR